MKLLRESSAALKVEGLGASGTPPYDSQANGAVEAAVKQVRSRMKTMNMCPEESTARHPMSESE